MESNNEAVLKGKPLVYYIGNVLIIAALALFIFIYYPFISIYFISPKPIDFSDQSFTITIPKIKAISLIQKNIDPFNEKEYKSALQKGVVHAKGSGLPGDQKGIFLFAHSSLPPWEMTRVNTVFLRLGELNLGDEITIRKDGKQYKYSVFDKKEVWPNEVRYLKEIHSRVLVLQTCTPIGTDWKRLLVFAKPEN
ncbi:sortase [Candidatus Daviesbacteria bacterium]|nr:sortase [Candidatus Daviesbacteria bacterium]